MSCRHVVAAGVVLSLLVLAGRWN